MKRQKSENSELAANKIYSNLKNFKPSGMHTYRNNSD